VLAAGSPLPPIRLEAAVSGRVIDNKALAGRKAVLVLHGARNTEAPKAVARAVRERWPDAGKVLLATVVDLRSFAGAWRRVAEAQLKSTHGKLADRAREHGLDPAEHVLIVPDWDGTACRTLGAEDAASTPVAVVVGPDGKVLGTATGDLAPAVVRLLE